MNRLVFILLCSLVAGTGWAQMPNRKAVLDEERAKFGATLTHEEAGRLLNTVALRLKAEGFGLLRKDAGNRCPVGSLSVSCDWLVHQPSGTGCDVLIDAPGTEADGTQVSGKGTPTWCAGNPVDLTKFVPPQGAVTPPEPPTPDPTLPVLLAQIQAKLAELEAAIRAIPPCTVPTVAFPDYTGTIKVPYLGSAPVTLSPKRRP